VFLGIPVGEEVDVGEPPSASEIARREVPHRVRGWEAVAVRRGVAYTDDPSGARSMDLYLPPGTTPGGEALAAVVLVGGYPGEGFRRVLGRPFREMGSTVSWARLVAASGMIAVAYDNRDPVADAAAVLGRLRGDAGPLGIDAARLGVWASSGNAPVALSLLMSGNPFGLACAALCYPYLLDLDGATDVAAASRTFGFANPAAGRSLEDLPRDVPVLVARAGADATPGLAAGIGRFVSAALELDLPLTLVNHAGAPHAFDLFDEGAEARAAILQVLAFLRAHLRVEP
jgi:hypothetical protein